MAALLLCRILGWQELGLGLALAVALIVALVLVLGCVWEVGSEFEELKLSRFEQWAVAVDDFGETQH